MCHHQPVTKITKERVGKCAKHLNYPWTCKKNCENRAEDVLVLQLFFSSSIIAMGYIYLSSLTVSHNGKFDPVFLVFF